MSGLGMMKTAARSEMLELGELTDAQLRRLNEICQIFHDVGLAESKKETEHWKNNHADMVKRNAELRDRPDLGDRCRSIDKLYTELDRLREVVTQVFDCHKSGHAIICCHDHHADGDKYMCSVCTAHKESKCS